MYKISGIKITGKKLVLFILYFTIIMETLISMFGFPTIIRYINDLCIVLIVILMRGKFIKRLKKDKLSPIWISSLVFFLVCTVSWIINSGNIFLYIWAFRNAFRGVIYLFCCYFYLDAQDVKDIFNKLYIIQFFNVFLVFIQFFILHFNMDSIGGIFGYGNGAGLNTFNMMLVSYYLIGYISKKEKLLKTLFVIMSSLLMSALAEEKAFFIYFVIILIITIIFSKFNFKKLFAFLVAVFALIIGLRCLEIYYPDMYSKMVSIKLLEEYSKTTFEKGYMIPRIGAFSFISKKFFKNIINYLFGLGFGNCDTSVFSIFKSAFYETYGYLNYRWFTHQWTFIETGYLGFLSFIGIFLTCGLNLIEKYRLKITDRRIILAAICNTICLIASIWYNATLKVDMCYLAYFSISIGIVVCKSSLANQTSEI